MEKAKVIKIIKIILIVILVLVVLAGLAGWGAYEFIIKPNSQKIIASIDAIVTDDEILSSISGHLTDEELKDITDTLDEQKEISENKEETKPDQKAPKKDKSEYKSDYEYAKDNIENEDFKRGLELAKRVDVMYILGLLKNGLTIAEKREMKAYLKERFSDGEIAEGVSLYTKYSYLLR